MNTPWEIVQASITRLTDRVDALPSVREATVSAASPLAVLFDTDTDDTLAYGTLVPGLAPGDRVLTLKLRHYVWVLGRKGGSVLSVAWGAITGKPAIFPTDWASVSGKPNVSVVGHTHTAADIISGILATGRIPYELASGRVTITPAGTWTSTSGAGAYGEATVTFPAGRFTVAPQVVASSSSSSNVAQSAGAINVSTTGATIGFRRANTTATGVDWVAVNA